MKISPRRHYQTLCCGLFAIALTWSTTAAAQQVRSNPLRQAAGASAVRQTSAAAPRAELEPAAVAETPAPSTPAPSTAAAASQRASAAIETSPIRQAAYRPPRDQTQGSDGHVHAASHTETSLLQAQQEEFIVDGGEIFQKGVMQKGVMQKGVMQKGGIVQKGVFQKGGIVQKGGVVQKGGKGDCGSCNGGGCTQCCLIPCFPNLLDNVEFFGGAQGFSGPANRGGTGSFGFHQGFNLGMPMPCFNDCFGVQLGLRATQDNLSGAGFPADAAGNSLFTSETRNQMFLTAGLFRRVDWGLQGGIVIDYLSDNWYADVSVTQMRGEASWVFPCAHELGFMFSAATDQDQQVGTFNGGGPLTEIWQGTDQYAFFYRHHPEYIEGAEARIFAGWSGDNDGIIGADLRLPLHDSLALEMGASYLIPEQAKTGAPGGGHEEESWNLAVSLVWYPGCRSAFGGDYFRPLLNVADNGSFRVGRR